MGAHNRHTDYLSTGESFRQTLKLSRQSKWAHTTSENPEAVALASSISLAVVKCLRRGSSPFFHSLKGCKTDRVSVSSAFICYCCSVWTVVIAIVVESEQCFHLLLLFCMDSRDCNCRGE
jgi:hypothetical protein